MTATPIVETAPIVFVIDDDASVRSALSSLIRSIGLRIEVFASTSEFLPAEHTQGPSCLILDVRLPGVSGAVEFLTKPFETRILSTPLRWHSSAHDPYMRVKRRYPAADEV
jgi:FixJ family two-component response regulator